MKCGVCGINTENGNTCEFCGNSVLKVPLISDADIEQYKQKLNHFRQKLFDPAQFEIDGDAIVKYKGSSEIAVVPGNIRVIAGHCFARSRIKKVLIPSSVEFIGNNPHEREDEDNNGAFWACRELEQVFIEGKSRLSTIGNYAFFQCIKLCSIKGIPDKIKEIKSHAFSGCNLDAETIKRIKSVTLNIADNWNDK
jgi:hypothetical protein